MAHQIRVSDEVYQKLLNDQRPRETFSEEVERLLNVQVKAVELSNILKGQAAYAEWKLKQLKEAPPAQR